MEPTMNAYQKPIFTLVSLFALLWQCGFAQDVERCLDLEEIYPDSTLIVGKASGTAAGEIIYQQESFQLSLDSFVYSDGSKGYQNAYLTRDFFGDLLDSQILIVPSNLNAKFEFTSEKETLKRVCFDFYDGGGQVNIAINGVPAPILNLNNLLELNQFDESPFGENIFVSVEEFDNDNIGFPAGRMCIEGDIRSITIGGQEMGITNICYEVETDECPIEEVDAIITECYADGGYRLLIDLALWDDDQAGLSDSFNLVIEGQDYGNFAYSQLPVEVDSVQIFTDALTFEVLACDTENTACCRNAIVDKSDCPVVKDGCISFDETDLGVFGQSTLFQPGDKAFSISEVDFYLVGMPTLFWTTLFGDLAVVESDSTDNPFSVGHFLFFEAISTGIDFTNYPEEVERVSIDVRLQEGPLNVAANGGSSLLLLDLTPGTYSIGQEVTLTVEASETNAAVNTLIFEGDIKSLLLGGISMYADNLCINPEEDCNITEVQLEPTDCNNRGEYYVKLDFKYEGTADSFYVYQNGDSLGRFNYKWLPIKLGPYQGYNNSDTLDFEIVDAGRPNCLTSIRLEEPVQCPEPCPISSIKVINTECHDEEGYHVLTFDLSRDTTRSGEFTLYTEDGESRVYAYDDLPVTLKLPNNADAGDISYKIQVCDSERDDCCITKTYLISCGPCKIGDLSLHPTECDSDGKFYVKLDFDYQGERADSFYVYHNDENLGLFNYKWLPVKLGPFAGTEDNHTFAVVDAENPDCGNKALLEGVNCPDPCPIGGIEIVDTECTDEGYHILTFDLKRASAYEGKFTLYTEDGRTMEYAYADLPVRVKIPYNESSNDISYKIKVCDNRRDDCCVEKSYRLTCRPDCLIREAKVYDVECIEDGRYVRLSLDLDHGYNEGSFIVRTEDYKESFKYSELPIRIKVPAGELSPDAGSIYGKLLICDENDDDCCVEASYQAPCTPPACVIRKINILDIKCLETTPSGTEYYSLTFDLERKGGSGSFKVWTSNSDEAEYFRYDDLPVTIKRSVSDATTPYRLKVCDSQYDNCCADIQYELPCQSTDCRIGELKTEVSPCNDDGSFYVDLNFRYQNVSEYFYVMTPADTFKFAYEDLPVRLGPIFDTYAFGVPIWVKDAEKDCGNETRLPPVFCGPNCSFQGLQAWTTECDESGQYYVKVRFQPTGVNASPGFAAFVDGRIFGPYSYSDNELKLGPFDANTGEDIDLLLIDLLDPINCNAHATLDPVYCDRECNIRELAAHFVKCTEEGTFIYQLNLWYDGPEDQEFYVSTSFDSLGVAQAGDFPKEFEIELAPNERRPVFYVCAVDQPNCCEKVEGERPDCKGDDCDLKDLRAEAVDCTTDGKFYIKVYPVFDTDQYPDQQFDVYLASEKVGTFSKKEFPATVGPFERRPGNGVYVVRVVKVTDQTDNKSCRETTQVRLSDCPPPVCLVDDIRIHIDSCDAKGNLFITVKPVFKAIDIENQPPFDLEINGQFIGTFEAGEFPVHAGPVEQTAGDLSVLMEQQGDQDCRVRKLFEPPYCEQPCDITEFSVRPIGCNPDGSYTFEIDLKVTGAANKYFDLYGPAGYADYFKLDELPLRVDLFIPDADTLHVFEACINDNPNCCARVVVENLLCPEGCPVSGITITNGSCSEEDDTFSFQLDFQVDSDAAVADSFYIKGQKQVLGPFALEDLPVNVGPVSFENDQAGELPFAIVGLSDSCSTFFTVAVPECAEIRVWPGDANRDRIANHRDLIYLGLAFGAQGPSRSERLSNWEAIPSTPWAEKFDDGINFKHADCNGDGLVDIQDKAVIARNYGRTRGTVLDTPPLPNTDYDPPIFVDLPQEGELKPGSTFTIPVILGTQENPAKDIYGFSFSINFDPGFIDPESVQVHYPVSWFGQEQVNVLTIDKLYEEDGRIEIAMTRNDQNDVSGYGEVAYIRGIIADIAGIVDTRLETAQPYGMSINDGPIPLSTQITEMPMETIEDPYTILESFNMFPIPAGDVLHFSNALNAPADEVRIFDLQGRQVMQTFNKVNEINVSDLPAGMYIIRLKIQGIVMNEKLLKR